MKINELNFFSGGSRRLKPFIGVNEMCIWRVFVNNLT